MEKDHVDFILSQWESEKPELNTGPMAVIGRISRAQEHIDKMLQDHYGTYGLNGGEFDVLASLRRAGRPYQMKPTQLFSSLMISSGTITNRLDQLEKKGLIERGRDPDDRRGILVTLTEKGIRLMDEAYPSHLENENSMIKALNAEERKELALLLKKLLVSFEKKGETGTS